MDISHQVYIAVIQFLGKVPLLQFEQEAGWVTGPVLMLRRADKQFAISQNRTKTR
jgi:hypothetical protein